MLYLTASGLRKIHDIIVRDFGGESGVLSQSLLESAASRPQTIIRGREPFEGIVAKAAALRYAIATWHPFVDGNKRSALTSIVLLLSINNVDMAVPIYVVKHLVLVAKGELSEDRFSKVIERWCSTNRVVSFLKGVRYELWPRVQLRFLLTLPFKVGYVPFRLRQVDWLAAGDEAMLRRTLQEYAMFRAQGYPKGEGEVELDDKDVIEILNALQSD